MTEEFKRYQWLRKLGLMETEVILFIANNGISVRRDDRNKILFSEWLY